MHLTLAEKGGININQSLGVAGRSSGLGFPGDGDRIVRTSQPNWVTRDARWEHSLLLGKGKGAKAHDSGSELEQQDNEFQGVDVDIARVRRLQFATGGDLGAPTEVEPKFQLLAEGPTAELASVSKGFEVRCVWDDESQRCFPGRGLRRNVVKKELEGSPSGLVQTESGMGGTQKLGLFAEDERVDSVREGPW